ncbi:hypothetical protein [Streptomyces lydicus]|uniref:hypothetical protein n=1 Tax=Streptomyces lydicus TaxID=47763 RepID=UPI00101174E8|nr:hypothetical protein [Streptomyces lydicus]MCZ1012052.1 hypothetical protein [Streptomyces lydicus]
MPASNLNYDRTSTAGKAIARLFRSLHGLGADWPGADVTQIVSSWLAELRIDPDGPAWQADAILPDVVSPSVDPCTITELLDKEPDFTRRSGHARQGGFYATYDEPSFFDDQDDGDELVIVVFPYGTVTHLRTAVAVLRRAGYTATAHDVDPRGYAIHVRSGIVYNLPDDAPVSDRANRLLWAAGFPCADSLHTAELPSHTTPTPVQWRPDWHQIDVISSHTTDGRRQETTRAIRSTLTAAGWRVDERGPETLHITPLDVASTDSSGATDAGSESPWQHGDVVLDAAGRVWTRASAHDEDQGWPWARGAETTRTVQGRPCCTKGGSTEEAPARPLTLLVRNGGACLANEQLAAPEFTCHRPVPADVIESIHGLLAYNWDDEKRDYYEQDPTDRAGHVFIHLQRISDYLDLHQST